jgi:hypothetical protein
MQINIKLILRLSTFLLVTGSLLACVDNQSASSETEQYPVKAGKKVIELTLKQTAFMQERDQKMLVNLGDFAFTLPDNWRDTSSYTYKSKQQNIALTVSFGKTRDSISLEKFVAQRRQELIDTMGDDVEFLSTTQGKVAMLPAIYQSFSFGDQSNKYQEYWATAYYAANKYLTLSYVGPLEDKTLQATFEHIMVTCQPSSRPQPEKIAVQYVWRQAYILRLQIPEELQPPRHYTYVSHDGSLKLKASLYSPGDNWPDTSVEDDAAKDLRFGGTPGISREEYQNNLGINQIDYVFQGGDPIEPTQYRAHRAQIAGFGGHLFLYLKGNASQTSQIDAFWLQLMGDLITNSSTPVTPKTDEANSDKEKPL